MISFDIRLDSMANEAVSSSGGNSDELDLEQFVGNVFLNVSARVSGTNTMTLTVEHATTTGGTFNDVPASALFNVLTGAEDTFDDVTTLATDQTLGLNRQQLRRFVRVLYAGTSLTHEIAVTGAGQPQRTAES